MSSSDTDASSTITNASLPSVDPITEDEIRVVLLQEAPVTTHDLIANFRERLKTAEDDDVSMSPVLAPKQKVAPKEEPVDNSPSKTLPSGSARETPSASKSSKSKRKSTGDDGKSGNNAPSKKVKTENESKPSVKDGSAAPSKNGAPSKGSCSLSTKTASTPSFGPVTEDEIRAVLLQKAPVTTQDLVAKFRARLKTPEDKTTFAKVVYRISKIQKANGSNYVVLRDESFAVFFNKIKNMSVKGPDSSLISTASTPSAGPVTEDEIKAFLLQKSPVITMDLVVKFRARLKKPEDDDVSMSPVLAPKQKVAPKEEPVDNSPSKTLPSGSARGTPSASKSSKSKRKSTGDDGKSGNNAPSKKVKTENESKPSVKDGSAAPSKNGAPSKGSSSLSTKTASTPSAGPVTEDEIRAVLLQKAPVTTQDLVAKFRARLKTPEDKASFVKVVSRISKIHKANGYVVLRDVTSCFLQQDKNMSVKGSYSSLISTASTPSAGPVTEDEIKAFLLQKAPPVTTLDLVDKFRARLKKPEAKMAFVQVLKRISKIQKTNGRNYVVLREQRDE